MIRHGSNNIRIVRFAMLALLLALVSGCQSVPLGTPHPFATLFHTDEPAYHINQPAEVAIEPVSLSR